MRNRQREERELVNERGVKTERKIEKEIQRARERTRK